MVQFHKQSPEINLANASNLYWECESFKDVFAFRRYVGLSEFLEIYHNMKNVLNAEL